MKKILSTILCFLILFSCAVPVFGATGVPKEVMDATKSVVRILSKYYDGSATGSGFVIKNEPGEVLIVTNDHVVAGNPYSISVWVSDDELVDAEIVFTTSAKDLCVLRVTESIDMKPLTLSTEDPEHGAAIYVVGYPGAGDILSDTQAHTSESVTITDGIISAIRTFTIESGEAPVKLLQVNAAINSGNSGGPLFDSEGVVIGVNTYKVNANSQGVFGSVDISELWDLLEQHGIEIATQPQEVIPAAKVFPVTTVLIAAGAVSALTVVFLFVKTKKKKAKTLRKYMEAHPNGLGVSEAVSLLLPVAIQLRDLHNSGKLHLQVSPDSICVSAAGATLKDSGKKETDRLSSGFAAPEIYKGVGFGAASDIYSFAAVLYFAATGKTPANSLQGELLEEEFLLLAEKEPVFTELIRKGMAFIPQERTQSMQELIYGVSAFHNQKSHILQPQKASKQKNPKTKKPKTTIKLVPILTIFILTIIVTLLFWNPMGQPKEITMQEQPTATETTESLSPEAAAYAEAEQLFADGETAKAAIAFGKLADYADSRERSFALWETIAHRETLPTDWTKQANMWDKVFVALKNDGTVLSAFPQVDAVTEWRDIVSIECGAYPQGSFVMGLKKDGSVITTVADDYVELDTSNWSDIVEIDVRGDTAVGLKADGTVVAAGSDFYGQCNVKGWSDIVSVSTTGGCTIGLKADGSVVACGNGSTNVSDWKDIASISTSGSTIGIKTDGTILTTNTDLAGEWDVSGWTDIVAADTAYWGAHIVGLRSDGTVVATGLDNYHNKIQVSDWTDIVEVYTTDKYTIGLRSDGTVVGTGMNINGCLNVSGWTDIAAIRVWYGCTVGLKTDGTVVYAGQGHRDMQDWTDIRLPN